MSPSRLPRLFNFQMTSLLRSAHEKRKEAPTLAGGAPSSVSVLLEGAGPEGGEEKEEADVLKGASQKAHQSIGKLNGRRRRRPPATI